MQEGTQGGYTEASVKTKASKRPDVQAVAKPAAETQHQEPQRLTGISTAGGHQMSDKFPPCRTMPRHQARDSEVGLPVTPLRSHLRSSLGQFPNCYPGGTQGCSPLEGWLPSTAKQSLADGEGINTKVVNSFKQTNKYAKAPANSGLRD